MSNRAAHAIVPFLIDVAVPDRETEGSKGRERERERKREGGEIGMVEGTDDRVDGVSGAAGPDEARSVIRHARRRRRRRRSL